jgi:hypothetical protein
MGGQREYGVRGSLTEIPTDIGKGSVQKWAQSEFSQAVELSSENSGAPTLVPVRSESHQAYFGVSSKGDGTVLVTYYNLGEDAIDLVGEGDSNFITVGKTPLQQFSFTVDSPEWARFQLQSARLMGEYSADEGVFSTFKRYVEGLPDSIRTATAEQFRSQKVGNCTFKGISAFLKDHLGSAYIKFRDAENQAYSRALPGNQKK